MYVAQNCEVGRAKVRSTPQFSATYRFLFNNGLLVISFTMLFINCQCVMYCIPYVF